MKGYYISRLQSGKQNHYECCGIIDLLREQVTSQLWEKLEKSPKGGVGGSENVPNHPSGSSVQVDNSARKWEARSIQLPRGSQRRAGGDIYGRELPLHLVVGPESLFVSRASSWEQELAAEQEHKTRWDKQAACTCLCLSLTVLPTINFRMEWLLLHSVFQISCKLSFTHL